MRCIKYGCNPIKDRLLKIQIKVVQIFAKCKEEDNKNDENSLHYLRAQFLKYDEEYHSQKSRLDGLEKLMENPSIKKTPANAKLYQSEFSTLKKLVDTKEIAADKQILEAYEVICCTCMTSHLSTLKQYNFQHVILDEATQALEAESLLCLTKGAEHAVLVGDIKQLGSVVQSSAAVNFGLDVPLIERFIDLGVPQSLLSMQYRMHPVISQFSNETFYNKEIQDGVREHERKHEMFEFPGIVGDVPTFFYDVASTEEFSGCGDSKINRFEAEAILGILKYMLGRGLEGNKIAIITFYDGQRGFLNTFLNTNLPREFISEVEIMSVDASQGKEQEYVILSCVRANIKLGVGFLDEYRRLNVSMTRAKRGLIVCGHMNTLLKSNLWSKLLYFYGSKDLIFTGEFERLERVEIELGENSKYSVERKKKYRSNRARGQCL